MTAHDIRAVVSAYLLSSGTLGRREGEIFKRFNYLPREDILNELQVLWEQEQVQRFTDEKKKHIWRATEKLNV